MTAARRTAPGRTDGAKEAKGRVRSDRLRGGVQNVLHRFRGLHRPDKEDRHLLPGYESGGTVQARSTTCRDAAPGELLDP